MFFTVLRFYRIDLKKPQDLKKDLLINMVTTLVMNRDQTYSIVMNSLLQLNNERVRAISRNMTKYKYKVNLDRLGVNKYFQFSTAFKQLLLTETHPSPSSRAKTFIKQASKKPKKQKNAPKPFEKAVEALKEIPEINAPMAKIEYIYEVFNTLMVSEIDEFWKDAGNAVEAKKLEIDYENLNGIAIYMALKAALPILIVDIVFVENFVSKAIMSTNRAYYMTVLHSAMTFIEENLPSYYDSKDTSKHPLKEHMTPRFVPDPLMLRSSPRSAGNFSNQLSKGDTSYLYDKIMAGKDMDGHENVLFMMEHEE